MTPDGRDELAALFDTDAEFGDVVAALAAAIHRSNRRPA